MLIKCPECATEVSDHADACPKCGWKVVTEYKKAKSSPLILPGMVVGGVGGFMYYTGYGVFGILIAVAGLGMFVIGLIHRPS